MSRMTLCGLTAAALALLSVGLMIARYRVMGNEVELPAGPNSWKVTLIAQGQPEPGARVWTAAPLDCRRQHVLREDLRSPQFEARPADVRDPRRRIVVWSPRPGKKPEPFKLRCDFYCRVDLPRPNATMNQLGQTISSAPPRGRYLEVEPRTGPEHERLAELTCQLTEGHDRLGDQARALFDHVSLEIANEPSIGSRVQDQVGPVQCLAEGSGDAGAKARLLMTLLRLRGIPARLVVGVTKGESQEAHYWVEAWLHERWVPMCPFNHHYGHVPPTYLVFLVGDLPLVRGKHIRDLNFALLVERLRESDHVEAGVPWARRFFRTASLYMLPPPEQRLVEFLLLLPVAALIVCLFRNVIGLISFGTFAPALLGLAFRDLTTLPGILVFLSILLVGWLMRRVLDRYHLLQVPRIALMLSLVVIMLVSIIILANYFSMPATRYISLFPLVILTGMIERFWTLEAEDGMVASFKTLFITLFISATIALVLSMPALTRHLFRYPETLGVVMALLLLIGRYTGYRLMELFRFRDFLTPPPRSELKLAE
jgi:7 transmembrane helices usually fused to an inactive transglutaminase/Transglutaminase-like superfamily